MIAKRRDSKGKVRYCPKAYNPQTGAKHGPGQILGPDVPGTYATEKEAKRVERRMYQALEDWTPPDTKPVTIAQWIERWLVDYQRKAPTTNHLYRTMTRALVSEYGDVPLRDFTRDQARAFALEHREHARIAKVAFNDAIYEAEISGMLRNPFERLKLPAGHRKRDLALTVAEVDQLADCALVVGQWGRVFRAAIVFSAYTGLRFGELRALEWSWFDRERATVEVRRQVDRFGSVRATKTGEGDTPDATRPPLTISVPPQARLALEDVPLNLSGPVFTLPRGQRLARQSFDHYWLQIRARFRCLPHDSRRAEELERLVWHSLRHTCATLMLEAGVSREQRQAQMRHSSPALLDSTYTHIERRAALERVSVRMGSLAATAEGLTLGAQGVEKP